jgi:plastocyanin
MRSRKIISIACSSLLAISSIFAADNGTISGKVILDGKAPAEKPIDFNADAKCKAAHSTAVTTRHYVVDASGGLANVFVYVKDGLAGKKFPASTTPVKLDQNGCLYDPYVLGVQVGQPLLVQNSDDTLHNVHALGKVNPEFNLAQPVKGKQDTKTFTKQEVFVKFKCDVHPWMFAFVGVVDNPFFAVTGADGSFKLTGLPDGEYTIAAIHPKIGTEQTMKVKVTGGAEGKADFKFAPKP